MKSLLLLFSISLLLFSCQKENNQPPQKQADLPVKTVKDSVSLNLDGTSYSYNDVWEVGVGNNQANLKLDSIDKTGHHYISNDQDTLLFTRFFSLQGKSGQIRLYSLKS